MSNLPLGTTKFCPKCTTLKSAAEFHKRGNQKDNLSFYCKECYYRFHAKRTYNISFEAYNAMLERSGGKCDMCSQPFERRPAIDHAHTCCRGNTSCGKCIRGLICNRCNTLLGFLETSPEMVEIAYSYIRKGGNP